MAIITLPDIRGYLDQLSELGDAKEAIADAILNQIIPRAEAIVLRELGPAYVFGTYPAASQKRIYHSGGSALNLPPHDTTTGITAVRYGASDATVMAATDYYYDNGALYVAGSLGYGPAQWPQWAPGVYFVTGKWGFGPAPDDVKEVCLEVAVNLWRGKDRGMWTEVVGAETTGLRFTGGLTKTQKDILRNVKRAYAGVEIA